MLCNSESYCCNFLSRQRALQFPCNIEREMLIAVTQKKTRNNRFCGGSTLHVTINEETPRSVIVESKNATNGRQTAVL